MFQLFHFLLSPWLILMPLQFLLPRFAFTVEILVLPPCVATLHLRISKAEALTRRSAAWTNPEGSPKTPTTRSNFCGWDSFELFLCSSIRPCMFHLRSRKDFSMESRYLPPWFERPSTQGRVAVRLLSFLVLIQSGASAKGITLSQHALCIRLQANRGSGHMVLA